MLPENLIFFSTLFIFNLSLLTILRIAFFITFRPSDVKVFSSPTFKALYIGIKFDARLISLITIPAIIFSWIPGINLYHESWGLFITEWYYIIILSVAILFYIVDFGNFSYLQSRINASLLALKDTGGIWWQMVRESYPVVKLTITLFLFILFYKSGLLKAIEGNLLSAGESSSGLWLGITLNGLFFLLMAALCYGKLSRYPLRWSDAFFHKDSFICNVALNPVLFFIESLGEKPFEYDREKLKELYPLMVDFFSVDKASAETLSLKREGRPRPLVSGNPNVVIIFMETFAAYKTGVLGAPILHSSPRFDALSKEGLLFSRFYVPMENTSRSLFAALFGIPDVSTSRSSSRNPLVVNQHTIVNAFKDYGKHYFLGGSANWGNIRGMLSHNIDDLNIIDEGAYRSPVHDVWGISDADLFMEANEMLAQKTEEPFFAIIQTAGNHRPFKIPHDSKGFEPEQADKDVLTENGFYSLEEYNGFRFLDHSLGYYFDLARKEQYFDNTVFLIFGDHGTGNGSHDRRFGGLSPGPFHVPFLIYAPQLIKERKRIDCVMSELDVMPTLAALMGKPYVNTTLGRNVLDPALESKRGAFTFTPFEFPPRFGFMDNDHYVNVEPDESFALYDFHSSEAADLKDKEPEKADYMSKMAIGFHEFAKYLLYHNKREEK
ncbi:MAG: sulfatase-like hydrolase/transferase [Deltaproteobacteria bacterium]|nr:sulfatase-like hydrolase/transferase [Deltaproteobacteria bacterium]